MELILFITCEELWDYVTFSAVFAEIFGNDLLFYFLMKFMVPTLYRIYNPESWLKHILNLTEHSSLQWQAWLV